MVPALSDSPSSVGETPGENKTATSAPIVETKIFESNVRLLPADHCTENHGKGKQRLRPGQEPDEPDVYDCGFYLECDEATLFPPSARLEDYRLTTADPIHDLKRWLTTPNQRISGEECLSRFEDSNYFNSSCYHEEHFRECILWAVEEIKHLHTTIRRQIEYFRAPPYGRTFRNDPIIEAMPLDALPTSQTLEELRRPDFTQWMVEMAIELDYLKEQEWFIRGEILELKWVGAKNGLWGEISELLEGGWVGEEDVQRVCCV